MPEEEQCQKISEALKTMKEDGTLEAIKEDYHLTADGDEEETASEKD